MKKRLKLETDDCIDVDKGNVSVHGLLSRIHEIILSDHSAVRHKEEVSLKNALFRVVAEDICAQYDSPLFDESLRDGYAVALSDVDGENVTFDLVGESGAGDSFDVVLQSHETWKVMTGGLIPVGCERVIPQEWCTVKGNRVTIPADRLAGNRFIKKRGCEFKKGDIIVRSGEELRPTSILRVAECGWSSLHVYRQPRCCFCCTGKELVSVGAIPGSAQKISSNQYLLNSLLEENGSAVHDYGIVADEVKAVDDFFQFGLQGDFDLILTTGGTGGGDFDLVESGFVNAGGTLICNTIDMRPGKSLVVGRKGSTIYIGLPGPPHAVHTVFWEIVAPLLVKMKGGSSFSSPIEAIASEDLVTKTRGSILIKEGVLTFTSGLAQVRKAGRGDRSNCNILIAPGRDLISSGEKVEVHLWGQL